MQRRLRVPGRLSLVVAAITMTMASAAFSQTIKEYYGEYEGGPEWLPPGGDFAASKGVPVFGGRSLGSWAPKSYASASVGLSFKGVSQYDLRNLLGGGSYIPPDTMGAIGATQFMETTNGVYGIYSKSTGALQSMLRADTFWANAGATGGMNGDARVMFDKTSQKWIAMQFGADVADVQIAVSTTSDATGPWQSTKFTGFKGGIADYPTLAIDKAGVYIGTNNFGGPCGGQNYCGETLNVISRADLFGAAPTAANVKQFVTPYPGDERGFAIQGVNSSGPTSGRIIAAAAYSNDVVRYNIANPGTSGATQGPVTKLGTKDYGDNGGGRQPDGTRNIDPLDPRIGASAWEMNGRIYAVYTGTDLGSDHTGVRWLVTDADTNAIIQQGSIQDGSFDYYEGSIAVNAAGQVVIGYNRSGYETADLNGDGLSDGNVSFMARTFNSDGTGALVETGELLLHVSPVDDYHNGSVQGAPASGRQRWGDYSAVTLDPTDDQSFWAIGEYAETWNNAAGCGASPTPVPGCTLTNGSTWGTWISQINVVAVPEPSTYALMMLGLGAIGGMAARRRREAEHSPAA